MLAAGNTSVLEVPSSRLSWQVKGLTADSGGSVGLVGLAAGAAEEGADPFGTQGQSMGRFADPTCFWLIELSGNCLRL